MKAHSIESTTDYDQFVSNEYQQAMRPRHVAALAESIQTFGFMPSKAIQVFRRNGKFVIVDGHHRFNAAKSLGVPVLYVVEAGASEDWICQVNTVVKPWPIKAFIAMHVQKRKPDYIALQHYIDLGFPCMLAAGFLSGWVSANDTASHAVQSGAFKVKTTRVCDMIVEVWAQTGIRELRKAPYLQALASLSYVPEFNMETFIARAKVNPLLIEPCANKSQALEVLEKVYNYRSQKKVNIAFLAAEGDQARKAGNMNHGKP